MQADTDKQQSPHSSRSGLSDQPLRFFQEPNLGNTPTQQVSATKNVSIPGQMDLVLPGSTAFEKPSQSALPTVPSGIPSELSRLERESDLKKDSPAKQPRQSFNQGDAVSEIAPSYFPDAEDPDGQMDLDAIKARTMYQMVEEIDGAEGQHRLLFVTNKQATLLAGLENSVQRLLDAFEVPKPKLVIQLCTSLGGTFWRRHFTGKMLTGEACLDSNQMLHVESQLISFMEEVVIPLAIETSAIVLCCANKGDCMLSDAFSTAFRLQRAKWGGTVPFTTIGLSAEISVMYQNQDLSANWRIFRRKSRTWRARDRLLVDHFCDPKKNGHHDLDPGLQNYILCDALDEKKGKLDKIPAGTLTSAIIRYLALTLPCLSVKTGLSSDFLIGGKSFGPASLQVALDAVQSGSPMLLIDLRPRPAIELEMQRQSLIDAAKRASEEFSAELSAIGTWDYLDVSGLAYFHYILFSDKMFGKETASKNSKQISRAPLHQAIGECHHERGSFLHVENVMKTTTGPETALLHSATPEQVRDAMDWLTGLRYQARLTAASAKDPNQALDAMMQRCSISQLAVVSAALVKHSNTHSTNVGDIEDSRKLVRELVRLDRLPQKECMEGLLLLRDAWDEYDAKLYWASKYKIRSKVYYVILLSLGIFTVLCTTLEAISRATEICLSYRAASKCAEEDLYLDMDPTVWTKAIFAQSLVASILVSLTNFANPAQRWRHLRSCCSNLESAIWQYRTRAGDFAISAAQPYAPQNALRDFLSDWRQGIVGGTDLSMSQMERKHASKVYKHFQYSGGMNLSLQEDNFHSPAKPEEYIEWRLIPMQEFYQARVPMYEKRRYMLQVTVFLCTGVSAALSYADRAPLVAFITSFATAITSWTAFSDYSKKMERYTSAIQALKNIRTWWASLTEVERASTVNVTRLITDCEAVIAGERTAWSSVTKNKSREQGEELENQTQNSTASSSMKGKGASGS